MKNLSGRAKNLVVQGEDEQRKKLVRCLLLFDVFANHIKRKLHRNCHRNNWASKACVPTFFLRWPNVLDEKNAVSSVSDIIVCYHRLKYN